MALTKVTYTDNVTVIGSTNLNAIQDEIIANAAAIAGKYTKPTSGVPETDLAQAVQDKLNAGGYNPPASGIPKTDLASDVQASLDKADSALQSHQDISGKADKSSTVSDVAYDATNKKLTKTINGTSSDIVSVATLKTDMQLSKPDVGLGNVDNTSDANKPISTATQAALDKKADYVTPQMYGATGDGTTDDTTAIQDCIDDCYSKGIYRIFFPKGTYIISSPILLYFTRNEADFYHGKGITLEGEHKGSVTIKKTGTGTYNSIDTVIYCVVGNNSNWTYTKTGSSVSILNMMLRNDASSSTTSYVIYGRSVRGTFKNLDIYNSRTNGYGINMLDGFMNTWDDIVGGTAQTFYEDGGTSTYVGRMGCFVVNNPYVLKSSYSTYNLLFGESCTGTFAQVAPWGNCHIVTIGTESPNLDCVVSAGTGIYPLSRGVLIDNIFAYGLNASGASYLKVNGAKLRVGSLTIVLSQAQTNLVTVCSFVDSNIAGSCRLGDIGNIVNYTNGVFDPSKLQLVGGNMSVQHTFRLDSDETTSYINLHGLTTLGGYANNSSSCTEFKNKCVSVVGGGYVNVSGNNFTYMLPSGLNKHPTATNAEWVRMPAKGSLILNDLSQSNRGIAGFISMANDGSFYGYSKADKAPIPIMFFDTEANVPSAAKKAGTLLWDTTSSKLKVYNGSSFVSTDGENSAELSEYVNYFVPDSSLYSLVDGGGNAVASTWAYMNADGSITITRNLADGQCIFKSTDLSWTIKPGTYTLSARVTLDSHITGTGRTVSLRLGTVSVSAVSNVTMCTERGGDTAISSSQKTGWVKQTFTISTEEVFSFEIIPTGSAMTIENGTRYAATIDMIQINTGTEVTDNILGYCPYMKMLDERISALEEAT